MWFGFTIAHSHLCTWISWIIKLSFFSNHVGHFGQQTSSSALPEVDRFAADFTLRNCRHDGGDRRRTGNFDVLLLIRNTRSSTMSFCVWNALILQWMYDFTFWCCVADLRRWRGSCGSEGCPGQAHGQHPPDHDGRNWSLPEARLRRPSKFTISILILSWD